MKDLSSIDTIHHLLLNAKGVLGFVHLNEKLHGVFLLLCVKTLTLCLLSNKKCCQLIELECVELNIIFIMSSSLGCCESERNN